MPSGHLYSGIPVNIRQQAEAEAFRVWWICESIHCQWGLRGVKRLPDALVQLIVRYRAPEGRLRVSHWLQVCRRGKTTHQLRKTSTEKFSLSMHRCVCFPTDRQPQDPSKTTTSLIYYHYCDYQQNPHPMCRFCQVCGTCSLHSCMQTQTC